MPWEDISTAPKDGSVIRTKNNDTLGSDMWAVRTKFLDGRWCANFGSKDKEDWQPFSPEPKFWRPT